MAVAEKKIKTSTGAETASQTVARAKAMLAQTKAEGSKSFAGSSYEKDYKAGKYDASPIPATYLNPEKAVNLPTAPVPPPVQPVEATNIGLGAQPDGTFSLTTTTESPEQLSTQPINSYLQMYQQAIGEMPDRAKMYQDTYGISDKQAGRDFRRAQEDVNKYQSQLNAIVAKSQADQLSLVGQGRGVTDVIIGGQQAQVAREAAIQALPVQAQLAAAQGNLEIAQQHVDRLFQLKMQDAETKFQYKTKVADVIYDYMNKQEQVRLQQVMQQQERKYQEDQEFLKMQRSLMMNAVQQGAPGNVLAGISGAKNVLDAISAAGQYSGDVLERQIKLAQLRKLNEAPQQSGFAVPEVKTINGKDMQWNSQTGKWDPINAQQAKESDAVFAAQESIKALEGIKTHKGLNSSVGPVGVTRMAVADAFGEKDAFIGDVENVISILTLNSYADAKEKGMTFGALSEGEWKILGQSATKLAQWRETDGDGNVVGYDVSQKRFKDEVDRLLQYSRRTLTKELGYDPTLVPESDGAAIDIYFGSSASTPAFNPSIFY